MHVLALECHNIAINGNILTMFLIPESQEAQLSPCESLVKSNCQINCYIQNSGHLKNIAMVLLLTVDDHDEWEVKAILQHHIYQ